MTKINYGEINSTEIKKEDIVLSEGWDKVFPKNENVNHKKVTFVNHFGITILINFKYNIYKCTTI